MKQTSCFILYFFLVPNIFSQIKGIVLDDIDMKPLSDVNISTGQIGTVTNQKGEFTLDVKEGVELEFSHIGYRSFQKKAKNGMKIQLTKKVYKLSEIVVESGLKNESFLRSTNSIDVIQQKEIRDSGADHLQEIVDRISNLNWAGGTSRPRYFQIRGIGERSHYFGEGPPNFSVGYVVDDIDLSGMGMIGQLYDLRQIEVFRGPQSSLYGSNAIGGLISIKSNQPSEYNVYQTSVTFGLDSKRNISGLVNRKITDNFFFRANYTNNYSNGFRNNKYMDTQDTNKKDEIFFRAKILFSPYNNLNINGTFISSRLNNGYDVWAPDNNDEFITFSDSIGEDSQTLDAVSFKFNYNVIDKFFVTGISSISKAKLIHAYDGDWANDEYWLHNHGFDPAIEGWSYSFYDKNERNRNNFTQEFRISTQKYIFGFYYKKLYEKDNASGYLFGGLGDEASSRYDFENLAGYFQSDISLNELLKMSANLRMEDFSYNYNGETFDNYYYNDIPSVKIKKSFGDSNPMLGYKLALSFKVNDFDNIFLSYAKGFKAGGANQEPYLNDSNRQFDPEFLNNLELGFKSIKDRYSISLTFFNGSRKNQQVSLSSQQDLGNPNSFYFYTGNSGKGSLNGFEGEFQCNLKSSLKIHSSLGLLNTFVEEFSYSTINGTSIGGGRESSMAPKITSSFGVKYEMNQKYISTNTSFKSGYYFSDSHDNKSSQYSLTNVTFGKSFQNFDVKIWIQNLFDTRYTTRGFYFGLIPPDYPNQLWKSYGDPRQLGITLDYKLD